MKIVIEYSGSMSDFKVRHRGGGESITDSTIRGLLFRLTGATLPLQANAGKDQDEKNAIIQSQLEGNFVQSLFDRNEVSFVTRDTVRSSHTAFLRKATLTEDQNSYSGDFSSDILVHGRHLLGPFTASEEALQNYFLTGQSSIALDESLVSSVQDLIILAKDIETVRKKSALSIEPPKQDKTSSSTTPLEENTPSPITFGDFIDQNSDKTPIRRAHLQSKENNGLARRLVNPVYSQELILAAINRFYSAYESRGLADKFELVMGANLRMMAAVCHSLEHGKKTFQTHPNLFSNAGCTLKGVSLVGGSFTPKAFFEVGNAQKKFVRGAPTVDAPPGLKNNPELIESARFEKKTYDHELHSGLIEISVNADDSRLDTLSQMILDAHVGTFTVGKKGLGHLTDVQRV